MVVIASNQTFKAFDRLIEWHLNAWRSGEDFRNVKWLRQEPLNLPGARHNQFVVFRQFIHTENGDDVLQRLIALENPLDVPRNLVMLLTNHPRIKDTRCGIEWVNRRVDAFFRNRAVQNRRRIKVGEGRCRRRVGKVVRWHINGLYGCNGTLSRCRDPLLQTAHIRCEGWLIAHRRRDTTKQGGNFRTGLREAENVINEEENVLPLITEIFRNGKARQCHTRACAWWFVHLAIDQSRL